VTELSLAAWPAHGKKRIVPPLLSQDWFSVEGPAVNSSMSRSPIKSEGRALLRRIILRRQPLLLDIVDSLGESPLTEESREEIREVLVEELCESGLREDDEPNE
jgi:hypothetical protein